MPNLPPYWKVRRELVRLGEKVWRLPSTIASLPRRASEPRRRAIYERDFDLLTRLTDGQVGQTTRIAIFLIFQRGNVAPSVLATCRWLKAEGYAPFVVSNGPLTDLARDQLAAETWRILERPNFGYDFGGYRDGIQLLFRWGLSPDRLIVMNDSVWLPVAPDLMQRLEEMTRDADIVGLLQDEKVRHATDGGQPTEYRHIESYFYLFKAAAHMHPAFRAFWRDYQMTDQKRLTIKNGEIGFSRKMEMAGLRLRGFASRSAFLERIAQMDNADLFETLRYAAYADRDIARAAVRLSRLDPAQHGWREAALDHIRRAVNRKRFNTTFPYANDKIFGTLFLKKSHEPIFTEMRRQYLIALEDGRVSAPPLEILREMKARAAPGRYDGPLPLRAGPDQTPDQG